ncbi:MAG: guanylate kinase [Oscillospiraceae bacterium]|nr:guanylate kinase [Oscillospiraceae bacterium]
MKTMQTTMNEGLLVVISGPAGSGKSTVINNIISNASEFVYSVSVTTREPREGEIHGKHYYFIDVDNYKKRIELDDFLEYEEYAGNYYGTPKSDIMNHLAEGRNVILEIEVKGAMNIKSKYPDAVLIFLLPPDYRTLEKRLRKRGSESEEKILKRLEIAKWEFEYYYKYDYLVVNNHPETAAGEILNIVKTEKLRIKRNNIFYENFYNLGDKT